MFGYSSMLDELERSDDMPEWARRARLRLLRDVAAHLNNHDQFRYERLLSSLAPISQEYQFA